MRSAERALLDAVRVGGLRAMRKACTDARSIGLVGEVVENAESTLARLTALQGKLDNKVQLGRMRGVRDALT